MLTITQEWLDLFPNWETEEGWEVNDEVDLAAYINGLGQPAKGNVIAAVNEHPPHKPS